MRNSYTPIKKSRRRAGHFQPSTTLVDFAEMEGLNLFSLEATVAASDTIRHEYTRGVVPFYHIAKLRYWLANHEVKASANV